MHGSKLKTEIKRVDGYLKEVVTFFDDSGKPISHIINPLMVELRPRDIAQLFVGALLVASPLCFTEEVWQLSESLPKTNIYYLMLCSFVAVTMFVYFNFYRFKLKGHVIEFTKRIVAIYLITTLSVILVLFLINKFPVMTQPYIAMKRVILIGFPAIFGATITDYLK
ncbi:MAG: DUF2391 family protein [Bacteriovoracaceae bacterium]|nr:DUF2391 family protein [Bacteriovoracaceae bacterium]